MASGMPSIRRVVLLLKVDAQTEATELVEKHIERFGDAGRRHCVALDNSFVSLASTGNIVGLDCNDFLKIKKQIRGIEPPSPAWEASILPMNHICIKLL